MEKPVGVPPTKPQATVHGKYSWLVNEKPVGGTPTEIRIYVQVAFEKKKESYISIENTSL